MALTDKLTAIANAIRAKTGSTAKLTLDQMPTEIANIRTGVETDDATATAEEIFLGKTAYVKGKKVTGTYTIDDELTAQEGLIEQIILAADAKLQG